MRWLRFSVAGLMAVVLLLGLGLGGLRANSEVWASALFTAPSFCSRLRSLGRSLEAGSREACRRAWPCSDGFT